MKRKNTSERTNIWQQIAILSLNEDVTITQSIPRGIFSGCDPVELTIGEHAYKRFTLNLGSLLYNLTKRFAGKFMEEFGKASLFRNTTRFNDNA